MEPLNRKETNLVNSVAEAVYYAKLVDHPQIRVLADFYHMEEEKEPLDALVVHQDWLSHIHLADTGRMTPGTGQYPYGVFAKNLRSAGYQGLISIECTVNDPSTELPASLDFLKHQFDS